MSCYIYCIHSLKTNKKYIGSSIKVTQRIFKHFSPCQWKDNPNIPLYKSMVLDGRDTFLYGIVEEVEEEDRYVRERFWIENLNTIEEGYNVYLPYGAEEQRDETIRERRKIYKEKYKERLKEDGKRYYQTIKEKRKEYQSQDIVKQKRIEYNRRYREKKKLKVK